MMATRIFLSLQDPTLLQGGEQIKFLGPQTHAPAQACATSPATASSGLAITTSLA